MFDPYAKNKEERTPPKSPLPAMRWTIYLIIAGMLLAVISHKFNAPNEHAGNFPGVELNMNPELAEQMNLGELARMPTEAMSLGLHPEAVALFEKVNAQMPGNAEYLYWLGLAKVQAGDLSGAEKSFLKSIALKNSPAARYYLGELYLEHLAREADGKEQMQLVLENPDTPEDLKQKAESFLK